VSIEYRFALPPAIRRQYYEAGHWRADDFWRSIAQIADAQAGVAFIDGERELTFAQLRNAAQRLGRAFINAGLQPGDAVAVHGRHCLESTITIAACAYAGLVPALLPHMFATEQIRAILDVSGARLLVTLGEDVETERALRARGDSLIATIVADHSRVDDAGCTKWSGFLASAATSDVPPRSRGADELALLIFSSGTTGEPKGVMHSTNTLRFSVETYARYQSITADDINLVVTAFGFVGR